MRQYRQGDVILIEVDRVPPGAKLVKRSPRGLVLAEGEVTGHAHVITDDNAELVTTAEAAELYLLVHGTNLVALTHDEHDTLRVEPGEYEVRRQREYSPQETRQVED